MRPLIAALLLALPMLGLAHSGRTNQEGCHHDRKRGGYHCHNGGISPRAAPVQSIAPRHNVYTDPLNQPNPYLPAPMERVQARERALLETQEKSLYFMTCEQAIASGHAPLHRGEPGYRVALDMDGNGVACEVDR